jgi:hypothetical protein
VRGCTAARLDDFFDGAALNFLVDIHDADSRAFGGKSEGNCAPNAAACASDDCNFAV